MDKNINIVLATDDNYAQHATVAITSVLVNTEEKEIINFYVIDDNISEEKQKKMTETVENFGAKIFFVETKVNALNDVFVSGNITRATYFRLDVANILPTDIHKVIYLDCDLLVLQDVANLWNFDMQGKPIAATEDFGILSSKGKCREKEENLNWSGKYSYFNAGVLIIDLDLWRKNNCSDELVRLVTSRDFRHHDQDALNFLFMSKWAVLDLKWNVIPPVFNMNLSVALNKKLRTKAITALNDVGILHYAGGYKPWEYVINKGFNEKYYEYLILTKFKDVKMPQPNPKKKGHSIGRQNMRLKWANIIKKF